MQYAPMQYRKLSPLEGIAYKQRMTNVISYALINFLATLAILFAICVALDTAMAAPASTAAIIEQTDPVTTSAIPSPQTEQATASDIQRHEPKLANALLGVGIIAGSVIAVMGGIISAKRNNEG